MERIRFPIDGVTYHTAEETDDYRRSGSWIWTTLGEMLRDAACEKPDVTYIAADDGSLTFSEVDALSEWLAASLLDTGFHWRVRAQLRERRAQNHAADAYGISGLQRVLECPARFGWR